MSAYRVSAPRGVCIQGGLHPGGGLHQGGCPYLEGSASGESASRGVCTQGVCIQVGVCILGVCIWRGELDRPPSTTDTVDKQAVCILLECMLVIRSCTKMPILPTLCIMGKVDSRFSFCSCNTKMGNVSKNGIENSHFRTSFPVSFHQLYQKPPGFHYFNVEKLCLSIET